jgi:hypothetical protein
LAVADCAADAHSVDGGEFWFALDADVGGAAGGAVGHRVAEEAAAVEGREAGSADVADYVADHSAAGDAVGDGAVRGLARAGRLVDRVEGVDACDAHRGVGGGAGDAVGTADDAKAFGADGEGGVEAGAADESELAGDAVGVIAGEAVAGVESDIHGAAVDGGGGVADRADVGQVAAGAEADVAAEHAAGAVDDVALRAEAALFVGRAVLAVGNARAVEAHSAAVEEGEALHAVRAAIGFPAHAAVTHRAQHALAHQVGQIRRVHAGRADLVVRADRAVGVAVEAGRSGVIERRHVAALVAHVG